MWDIADMCRLERFPNRAMALDAEAKAIRSEHPLHNMASKNVEPDAPEKDEYDARICPDCGHDYLHDDLGRCLYPHADRVCGWHLEEGPDGLPKGPTACPSRIPTPESLERGRLCYYGQCGRCCGEGCPEYWLGFEKAEAEYLAELRSHDCEKAGCGPVCTAFES